MNFDRLIEARADWLLGLAIGVGRLSELLDRFSTTLCRKGMRDMAYVMRDELKDIEVCGDADDMAVPDLSHDEDLGQGLEAFSRSPSFEREHEQRPDRGWQRLGDATRRVIDDLQARRGG